MKLRLSIITGNRNKYINIMSNGRVILFPMPHGTAFNFSFVSIWTHVSLSTVQCGQRIIGLLRDHLQSHRLLEQYKTCTGNGRPDSHYPLTFWPLQNHWKVLNCHHVFIPLWQLYCLCLPVNSHLTPDLEWFPFIMLSYRLDSCHSSSKLPFTFPMFRQSQTPIWTTSDGTIPYLQHRYRINGISTTDDMAILIPSIHQSYICPLHPPGKHHPVSSS